MKRTLLFILMLGVASGSSAQDLKIGVRSGLNYFKMLGELESQETQSFSSGFHFGITGTYYFNDFFGLRTEILYIQKSSLLENEGEVYSFVDYAVNSGAQRDVIRGQGKYTLKRTFNTFTIPIQAVIKPFKKFEVFGGINFEFVAGSIGQGNLDFDNLQGDDCGISFDQTLNFNYNTNQGGDFGNNNASQLTINYDTDGDGEKELYSFSKTIGAYRYFNEEIDKNLIRSFDLALTGGVAYYINSGLYMRATFDYGLRDITREEYDFSLEDLPDDVTFDETYIFRDDFDRKIGLQISLGFQF